MISSPRYLDEIVDFITSGPSPDEIVAFRPSQTAQDYLVTLLEKKTSGKPYPHITAPRTLPHLALKIEIVRKYLVYFSVPACKASLLAGRLVILWLLHVYHLFIEHLLRMSKIKATL